MQIILPYLSAGLTALFTNTNSIVWKIADIFFSFAGALLGVLAAVYVFYEGKRRERLEEVGRLNDLKQYLIEYINRCETRISKQVELFKLLNDDINNDKNSSLTGLLASGLDANEIASISNIDLAKVFRLQCKEDTQLRLIDYHNSVSYLGLFPKDAKENFNIYISKTSNLTDRFNEIMSKLDNQRTGLYALANAGGNPIVLAVIPIVDQCFSDWIRVENYRTASVVKKELLLKLQDAIIGFRYNALVMDILLTCKYGIYLTDEIEGTKNFATKVFQLLSDDLQRIDGSLKKVRTFLE